MKGQQIIDFSVCGSRVKVQIEVISALSTRPISGARLSRSVAVVEVNSPTPQSLLWYFEVGNRLENLFSL
jgi:hypothetical protein